MRRTIMTTIPSALLIAAMSQAASAMQLVSGGALTTAAESAYPVENVHYYGYGRGYHGGYGRGYYGGYGRGYYGYR